MRRSRGGTRDRKKPGARAWMQDGEYLSFSSKTVAAIDAYINLLRGQFAGVVLSRAQAVRALAVEALVARELLEK